MAWAYQIAEVFAWREDKDSALEWPQRAYQTTAQGDDSRSRERTSALGEADMHRAVCAGADSLDALRCESPRSLSLPRRAKCLSHGSPIARLQPHIRASFPPPATRDGHERGGLGLYKRCLLLRRKQDRRELEGWIAERRKDLPADTKIGVSVVLAFARSR
jgi:hypothetical protein